MTFDTPQAYARHLATYIASPTKIESYTRLEFGEAPPLRWIADERYRIERSRRPMNTYYKDNPAHDGKIFTPAGLVKLEKPKPEPIVLPKLSENPFKGPFVAERVVELVAKDFGITVADMKGPSRKPALVDPRAVVIAALKRWGRYSFPQIGRALGRDHTSAIHSYQHFDVYAQRNPLVLPSYNRLVKLIEEAERAVRQPGIERVAA